MHRSREDSITNLYIVVTQTQQMEMSDRTNTIQIDIDL